MTLNPLAKIALGAALAAAPSAFASEADRTFPADGGVVAAAATGPADLPGGGGRDDRFGLAMRETASVSLAPAPASVSATAGRIATAPAVVVTAPKPLIGLDGLDVDSAGLPRAGSFGRTGGAEFEDEWTDPFRGYVSPTASTSTLRERRSKRLQPGQSRWQWKALSTIQYTMSDSIAFKAGYKPMGSEGKMPFVAVVWRY